MKIADYLKAQNAVTAFENAINVQNKAASAQTITVSFGDNLSNISIGPLSTTMADGSSEALLAAKIVNAITNYYSDKVASCRQDMKALGVDP